MQVEYYITKIGDEFCNSLDTFKSVILSNIKFTINANTISYGDSTANYTLTTDLINNETERLFILKLIHEDKDLDNSASILLKIFNGLHTTLINSGNQFKIISTNNELENIHKDKICPWCNGEGVRQSNRVEWGNLICVVCGGNKKI